jgi:hypothetical protein
MTMSLQEISDRLEIQELFGRYCHAVDTMDWELYESVFSDDAIIDYTAFGAPRGTVKEISAFLADVMPTIPGFQHMIGSSMISIAGDRATSRTICFNPMVVKDSSGTDAVYFHGLWYEDQLVRTERGWKISSRSETACYTHDPSGLLGAGR